MNGKLGLSGLSIVFVMAILSACGGNSESGSSSTSPPADNSTTNPPPDNSSGPQRPANIAGFVYGVSANGIAAYSIDSSTGALSEVPGSPYPAGDTPTLSLHPSDRFIYASNLFSDDVWAYAINPATGALSQIPGSPYTGYFRPEPVNIDPSGKFAYVASGGNKSGGSVPFYPGQIFGYSINPTTGELSPIAGSPFAGPPAQRLFTFNRSGSTVYVMTGNNGNDPAIRTYHIEGTTGALTQMGASMPGPGPRMIAPSGEFAYSCAGDLISTYQLDPATGVASKIDEDIRMFNIGCRMGNSGQFLYAAYESDHAPGFRVFAIDAATGKLSEIAGSPFAFPGWADDSYYRLLLHPPGKFLYLANGGKTGVYAIDPQTGAPSEISGSPFEISATGGGGWLTIDPSGRVGYSTECDTNGCVLISTTINTTTGALTPVARLPLEASGVGGLVITNTTP